MDGIWTTDSSGHEENDGNNNINNVLFPEDLKAQSSSDHPAAMSGVTPNSTTAALAAQVPKEGQTDPTISSAAPDSTSAELTKQSMQEQNGDVPGSFPAAPMKDPEGFSVNPIPASSGIGNPVQLRPGEKVPDPSAVNENTVGSTVRTDRAAYEADASAPFQGKSQKDANDLTLPTESKNLIPESSLPMGQSKENQDPGYTIHSVGPASTTAALAAGVPLESQKQTNGNPVGEVPGVVKDSMPEAHRSPEAAASHEAVREKKDLERELQQKVDVNESGGAPAPTTTAATTEAAPRPTGQPGSAQLSPRSTSPVQPTVTTGAADAKAPAVSGPGAQPATGATVTTGPSPARPVSASQGGSHGASGQQNGHGDESESKKKRRSRTSEFFSKLKDKFK